MSVESLSTLKGKETGEGTYVQRWGKGGVLTSTIQTRRKGEKETESREERGKQERSPSRILCVYAMKAVRVNERCWLVMRLRLFVVVFVLQYTLE